MAHYAEPAANWRKSQGGQPMTWHRERQTFTISLVVNRVHLPDWDAWDRTNVELDTLRVTVDQFRNVAITWLNCLRGRITLWSGVVKTTKKQSHLCRPTLNYNFRVNRNIGKCFPTFISLMHNMVCEIIHVNSKGIVKLPSKLDSTKPKLYITAEPMTSKTQYFD